MHWVKATAPDGRANWLNLAAVPNMMRTEAGDTTIIFLGGCGVMPATGKSPPRMQYATTATVETPEELLAMPRHAARGDGPGVIAKAAIDRAAKQAAKQAAKKAKKAKVRA